MFPLCAEQSLRRMGPWLALALQPYSSIALASGVVTSREALLTALGLVELFCFCKMPGAGGE